MKAAGTLALGLAAVLFAARTASAAGEADVVHPGVHLSWVRGDGAGICPDAAAIEAEVSERLGDNPFARTPTQFIEAIVTQKPAGFEVSIAMRASSGLLLGNRSLTSSPGDCRSIATAAALTIAILIDPDALARAPAPKPPSSQRSRSRPARAFPRGASRRLAVRGGAWSPASPPAPAWP